MRLKPLLLITAVAVACVASQASAQTTSYAGSAQEVAQKLLDLFPRVDGMVVGLDEGRILIDLGAKDRVAPGMEFQVYREGEEFRHPYTGQALGTIDKEVGRVRILEVREKFSIGLPAAIDEPGTIRPGDRVRVTGARIVVALPAVDAAGAKEVNARALTRDLSIALTKTGRFEVFDDRRLRTALPAEKVATQEGFNDPAILKILAEKLRVPVLLLARMAQGDSGLIWDVEVVSTSTGATIAVASVGARAGLPVQVAAAPYVPAPVGPSRAVPGATASGSGRPSAQGSQPAAPTPRAPRFLAIPEAPTAAAGQEGSPSGPETSLVASSANPSTGIEPIASTASTTAPPQAGQDGASANAPPMAPGPPRVPTGPPLAPTAESLIKDAVLPYRAVALAVGDVTGDGKRKLVLSDGQRIYVYALQRKALEQIWVQPDRPARDILALDVADINGNGRDEIFVTSYEEGRLSSAVVEYNGREFLPVWERAPYYFRVLPGGGRGPNHLYAQKASAREPFAGPAIRMTWEGTRYAEGTAIPLPPGVSLYGMTLADMDGSGIPKLVSLDPTDTLRIYDPSGDAIFRAQGRYGGSDLVLEAKEDGRLAVKLGAQKGAGRFPIQSRVEAQELRGGGGREIVVPQNLPTPAGLLLLRPSHPYNRGKLFGLAWEGRALRTLWETQELPGAVADFAVADLVGDGSRQLVVAVVEAGVLRKTRTQVLVFPLRPAPGGTRTAEKQ